jgi:predicted outer membrane protein
MKFNMKTELALAAVLALKATHAADISPTEARAIVKEAYIYGFPLNVGKPVWGI